MKIFVFIFLLLLQLFMICHAQKPITINSVNTTLGKIFKEIESKSPFRFYYSNTDIDINARVNLALKDGTIEKIMDKLLANLPYQWNLVDGKMIVIKKKLTLPVPEVSSGPIVKEIITGTVTDDSGQPLQGVTVSEKGTTNVILTDSKGVFNIKVRKTNVYLVFNHIGYLKQTIPVASDSGNNIKVILKPTAKDLDDVIVIGYGTVKKKDLTGSVGIVNMSDLQKAPVASFDEALAGRIAGVSVGAVDGQPGGPVNIVIRGNNSITQDNTPLYIIDGFPIENPINDMLNPQNIESIEILKDASATAIYGARAANGVIVITTKKGKSSVPLISYSTNYGVSKRLRAQKMMDAYQFLQFQNEAYPAAIAAEYFTPYNKTLDDYKNAPTFNWEDQMLQTAPFVSQDLSLRGSSGNGATTYSLTGSFVEKTGIIINTGFKRYNGGAIISQKVNDQLKISLNTNYSNTENWGGKMVDYTTATNTNDGASVGSVLYQSGTMTSVWTYRPIAGNTDALINETLDPSLNSNTDYRYNPIINQKNIYNNLQQNNLLANLAADYKINSELTLRITGGFNRLVKVQGLFYNSNTNFGDINTVKGVYGPNGTLTNSSNTSFLNENTLTYDATFKKVHRLNVIGGFTTQTASLLLNSFTATHVPNENLGINALGQGISTVISTNNSNNGIQSYLARVNYIYDSKYYLTFTMRGDGSSKFAPENRWGFFPSGAFSWRFSEEKFMKNVQFVNSAKLRTSYGLTGNNRVRDFAYFNQLSTINGAYSFNNSFVPGISQTALGNPNLKWEATAQSDIGLDIDLFSSKINIVLDYYHKETNGLITDATLPGSTGFTSTVRNVNLAGTKNKGFEFEITSRNISHKRFNWTTSFNISTQQGEIKALDNGPTAILKKPLGGPINNYAYISQVGGPIGEIYGLKFDGLYQYSDFVQRPNGSLALRPGVVGNGGTIASVLPGNEKFVDINQDGVLDTYDQTVIGHGQAKFFGGLSNNFKVYDFDVSVFFSFNCGNDIVNANRITWEGDNARGTYLGNAFASYANRWTPDNQNTLVPRVGGTNGLSLTCYSSRYVEDGSYLKLRTVQIGYALPANVIKRCHIKSMRLFASAQNVWTWTKYSGLDPEVSTNYPSQALTPGFDYATYPRARTITVGCSISL